MNELLDTIVPIGAALLALIVGSGIALRVLIPRIVVSNAKRKLPTNERETFEYKQEMLTVDELVELYAPQKHFMKEIDRTKDEKPRLQIAWLSPFPVAVKMANARNKPSKVSRRVLQARRQIAEAASGFSVAELSDSEQPGNSGPEHFSITLQLNGKPEAKVKALESVIRSTLGLHSLVPADPEDYRSLRYVGHAVAPVDKIELLTPGTDFFEAYPAQRVTSIPLAVKANGEPWALPTHHTLIHGTTGSGKGSPIQGMIRQLEPFVHEGIVKLYGIDPKSGEFKPYKATSLFSGLAIGDYPEMIAMVNAAHKLMKDRQSSIVATKANDFGRTVPFDRETPLVIIFIDEFLSLLSALKTMGKPGVIAIQRLTEILAQGRSGNIFVVAATQAATKELMGDMRENFPNKIVLRLEDGQTYWNDLWLGDGSSVRGIDATKIRKSGSENGYATAGVGYVKEESGDPVKVRFARTNTDDLADLISRNPPRSTIGAGFDDLIGDDMAHEPKELTDDDLDASFGFEDIPDDDEALPVLDFNPHN